MPVGRPVMFFAGSNAVADGQGLPLGDGLRCAGVNLERIAITTADANGTASIWPGVASLAGWEPGTLRRVQAWYRDPVGGACGSNSNLSNALELIVAP